MTASYSINKGTDTRSLKPCPSSAVRNSRREAPRSPRMAATIVAVSNTSLNGGYVVYRTQYH